MKKIELLAPAGDLEKLKAAINYGADAVYIGGEKFGLRAASKNFTRDEMIEGIKYVHDKNKKIYVTCNIIPHNDDLEDVESYLQDLQDLNVDALIIADPAFLMFAQNVIPNMELHLSTQANTTNYKSAEFWHKQGFKRIVTARELSFDELKTLREKTPKTMEIEAFVHGAMCISYSGRCLISNYMTGRDANKGECAQPCRWNYALVEEKRPGEYFPIEQDEGGTYFFNSKDLCLIEYIPQLIEAGVDSFKIEGRIKTAYYVATVVRAYRMAIDEYYAKGSNWKFNSEWMEELTKVSYRDFTTGFFENNDTNDAQNYGSSSYIRNYDFLGWIKSYDKNTCLALVEQRNKFVLGDSVEAIGPNSKVIYSTIEKIYNDKMEEVSEANIPMQHIYIKLKEETGENYILRKKI